MPVVQKTHGGRVFLRAVDERVSVGDRVDVPEEYAVYLVEDRGDFKPVDRDVDDGEPDGGESGDDADSEGFDPGEFVDRTPMDDVIEDIHAGMVDDHLDAVAEAASRVGVEDAVGERRAELAEEE